MHAATISQVNQAEGRSKENIFVLANCELGFSSLLAGHRIQAPLNDPEQRELKTGMQVSVVS